MERPIIGITISVNFSSLLELTMPINLHHFAKWYIITDQKDKNTTTLCHHFDPEVVECQYFDFQENGKLLNKGGALRLGQITAHLDHPDAWYLILDADILLPDNLKEFLTSLDYARDTLYGVEARYDFASISEVKSNNYQEYIHGDKFTGFFQLYGDANKYYTSSYSLDKCDDLFRETFSVKKYISGLHVHHLGKSGIGVRYLREDGKEWNAKLDEQTFLRNAKFDPEELSFTS